LLGYSIKALLFFLNFVFLSKVNDSFKKPLVKFALITDVQYADIDGFSSYGYFRYYRNSIKMVERVIKKWNKQEDLNFILQLGDLIDGYVNYKLNQTKEALEICLNVLNMINVNQLIGVPKLMHIWGNHEVFSLGPYELFNSQLATARLLNGSGGAKNVNYYSIDLTERLRLVVLDFFEISILGSNRKDKEFLKNKKLIDYYSNLRNLTKNPWEKDYFNRFQENNGAVSQTQLSWLRRQLNECKKSNKKVFIAGHNPILRETSDTHQSWNSEDILEVIWSFSETVLVHFNGHIHIGVLKFILF
jgi:manganese-dependent ADP-ribose/CDP-alcohol diphosphatase